MSESVGLYRIWCITEGIYVTGWSETELTVCPNNNEHTIDETKTALIETLSSSDVDISGIHAGVSLPSKETGFTDLTGYDVYMKGYEFTAAAGEITEHSACYTAPLKLCGAGFRIGLSAPDHGDSLDFEIADVDGLYYPPGTVLAKFGDSFRAWPGRVFERLCSDAKDLPAGIHIRFRYYSTGAEDVIIQLEHYLRTTPA